MSSFVYIALSSIILPGIIWWLDFFVNKPWSKVLYGVTKLLGTAGAVVMFFALTVDLINLGEFVNNFINFIMMTMPRT